MNPVETSAEHVARTIESPVGPLTLVANDKALVELSFGRKARVFVGAATTSKGHPILDHAVLDHAVRELADYFAKKRDTFDVPLDVGGTPFQRRVYDALVRVPFGETCSYGHIAREIGQPNASRAVGMANNKNPIAIIVPCHRVVGANGSLTGYGGGLPTKEWLLAHERREGLRGAGEQLRLP